MTAPRGQRRLCPASGSRSAGRKPTPYASTGGEDSGPRRLSDKQVAIKTAIDANMDTIRQLQRTNELLAALLPAPKRRDAAALTVTDPTTGRVFDFSRRN